MTRSAKSAASSWPDKQLIVDRAEHQLVEECRVGVRAELTALETVLNDLVVTPDSKVDDLLLVPSRQGRVGGDVRYESVHHPAHVGVP
jgi:hypothetical protein